MNQREPIRTYGGRRWAVTVLFSLLALALLWRDVDLQLMRKGFLQEHGDARHLRVVQIPAHRGMITDRNGEPLAVSTPVHSVWAVPRRLLEAGHRIDELAALLDTDGKHIRGLIQPRLNREFVYLRRHVDPDLAERVMALGVPGVFLEREFRRYYPAGEVTAHVIGFTNVDDAGQEGVELAYDASLRPSLGAKRVIKDRIGRIVENVESIQPPRPGRDLALSIDKRIQYLAYRELKAAIQRHDALAGSMVVLDAETGEVLAMVNQPSFNPNNRGALRGEYYRNRAVTDLFEPGSTVKVFTVAAALESGRFTPSTPVDTSPGLYRVGRHTVRDLHNYGILDLATVLTKSSNVGSSRIALSMEPERLWQMFHKVGFGSVTGSAFPGEAAGRLPDFRNWREIEHATLAFGYGLSVNTLQLAQAFGVMAADGMLMPVTLQRVGGAVQGQRVLSEASARQVRAMLQKSTVEGTARLSRIPGYTVAGKTGTVHKNTESGYAPDRYRALFAGMAPASAPKLVAVVMVDEPRRGQYFGGQVAAPIFSQVIGDALRLLDVPPDDLQSIGRSRVASLGAEAMVEGGGVVQ